MTSRVNFVTVELDAPGPWLRLKIADRTVYMRVDGARAAARVDEAGTLRDLAVACDLDQPGQARLVINPHQAHWAGEESTRARLLERAQALWRRHATDQTGELLTHEAGAHVYEFWADTEAGRVEITRRARQASGIPIDEYLGHADRLGSEAAEVHLHQTQAIANELLYLVRALVIQCWRDAHGAAAASESEGDE